MKYPISLLVNVFEKIKLKTVGPYFLKKLASIKKNFDYFFIEIYVIGIKERINDFLNKYPPSISLYFRYLKQIKNYSLPQCRFLPRTEQLLKEFLKD